ncbi:Metabotropic GABA-B receptor subtype 2, isoform C [Chamberlinius hualienensis]
MKAFFDMIHWKPLKYMLFGAACTQVTDPVAKTSKFWHLTQLSYADTHPMFTQQNYPYLFRVVPSENEFNAPRIELLHRFNWTIVGTLFQNEPRYALAHNKLLNDLDNAGVRISTTQSFTDEIETSLKKLKDHDVRIILGNFEEKWARRIFCQAYRLSMYGRRYQWIIVSMYESLWWKVEDAQLSCRQEELIKALEGYIATDLLPLRTNDVSTLSGLTARQYKNEYDRLRGFSYSRFHGYAYDGMWTVALAIRAVNNMLGSDSSLTDFKYRDPKWGRLFLQALANTSFEGVTGPVKFNNNDRQGYILLKQFQDGQEEKIGEYDGINSRLDLSKGSPIKWRGNSPPRDATVKVIKRSRVSIPVYAFLASVASLGILVAIIFLAINIRCRNHRYIKMSSPYLNNLIIIGCMLIYASIILLGMDSELISEQSLPYICTVRAWVLMAGFTLAFGSMFSKTWRVHAIFTNIKLNKKVIKDYQLFIIVGVLVVVDVAIMTTWQVVDPFYRETKTLQPQVHPSNEDLLIIPQLEYCKSDKMTAFMVAVYAYKGLLMVIGCFLAWETRHVSIPALNDSKYIGMSVYNVVIMCVMGAAVSHLMSDQQNAAFILISAFILFCSTTTLCLVFVPKLVELKRSPGGGDIRTRTTFKPSSKKQNDSFEGSSDFRDQMKQMQEENQKCRKTLREKDLELQALLKQLGESVQSVFGEEIRIERGPMMFGASAKRTSLSVTSRHHRGNYRDEDSFISISSSPMEADNATLTTLDTAGPMPRKQSLAYFPSHIANIMAAAVSMPPSMESHSFDPLPSLNNDDDIDEVDHGDDNESQSDDQEEEEVEVEEDCQKENCKSGNTCKVFTVGRENASLNLGRTFSWGRKGYQQMEIRRKTLTRGTGSLRLNKRSKHERLKQEQEEQNTSGSWPSVTFHDKQTVSISKFCAPFKKQLPPRQISEKRRKDVKKPQQQQQHLKDETQRTITSSLGGNIKCDVIEYL